MVVVTKYVEDQEFIYKKMTSIDLYKYIHDNYIASNISPEELKRKVFDLLNRFTGEDKIYLSQVIIMLIWHSSDTYHKFNQDKLWNYSMRLNETTIHLDKIVPYTRGIINKFIDMYINNELRSFS